MRPDRAHKNDLHSCTNCCHPSLLFDPRRLPCRRLSTYNSTGMAFAQIDQTLSPICVAPKPKRQKRTNNFFLNNQGFPDQSNDYDNVLHTIDGGPILCKLHHPVPALILIQHSMPLSSQLSMRTRCVNNWTCLIWIPTSRKESMPLSENIGLFLMRRVYLFQSRIMNASSTQERHGPSQSSISCTVNARQSSCTSVLRP